MKLTEFFSAVAYCDFAIKLKSRLMAFLAEVIEREASLDDEYTLIRDVIKFQMGKEGDTQEIFSLVRCTASPLIFNF